MTVHVPLKVTLPSKLVHLNSVTRIGITYAPNVQVHVTVNAPGRPLISANAVTDARGRLVLVYTAPSGVRLNLGHAAILVTVTGVDVRPAARVTGVLHVSDLVMTVAGGHIAKCAQTQTIYVAYRPYLPLHVVLSLPHNRFVTLSTRTDLHGNATLQLRLGYVQAVSPVRIVVRAFDARPHVVRMESAALGVALPDACQKKSTNSATVTVTG